MAKRRHAPIEQLREASKVAEQILRDKGLHTKESAIDAILAEGKVRLPGLPSYLPHQWTLVAARKALGNLLIIWLNETRGSLDKREDHREFFGFLVKQMDLIEKKQKREVDKMPKIIKGMKGMVAINEVFKPMDEMETTHTMKQFLIDSFAVAVILKQHNTVSEYVEWFDEWTRQLEQYWIPKDQRNG